MGMNKATKWVLWSISMTILAVIIFTIIGLTLKEQFGVKEADIDRKIYEQSKSYVHGKLQDLAKYYEEYQNSDEQGKQAIKNLIQMNFADLEKNDIENNILQEFLIEMRGY
jgi:hypothetical protein